MSDLYYVGNYREDSLNGDNSGWLVGTFMKQVPRKNDDVEIKYWEYKAGQAVKDYQKISSTIECTFILRGKTKCLQIMKK